MLYFPRRGKRKMRDFEKTSDWGKKELAYPIKKKNDGYYFLLAVKLPKKTPAELDTKLKLEEGLLRYLLVKKD
jgi:small subunit ribosomal protein S6